MSLPTLKNIELVREGAVLIATIARPEALNALNNDSIDSISALADFVAGDAVTKVLIITGKGEKSFVAGADIKGFEGVSPKGAEEIATRGQTVFTKLTRLEKPVIAAVNGDLTVKRLMHNGGMTILQAENPEFSNIELTEDMAVSLWGVVTSVIHSLRA
jgi:1,4-dihydroxy-2-naphthoyl-CoA synthase